jgi:CDP-ribitol ribitolphosphotransferase
LSTLEYRLASVVLRVLGWVFAFFPGRPNRVVLATARLDHLEGNLLAIDGAVRRLRPGAEVVQLLEPYGYGLAAKVRYLLRTLRGVYHVRTAGLVIVDNAWLPIHVAPHPRRTTVVQVWHATGALKRFGADTVVPLAEPERTFLHRHYDFVVTSGERSREPWSRALRTPVDRVLALGSPRTDMLLDPTAVKAARERVLAAHPALAGRTIVLWAPTFRGRGRARTGSTGIDGARLRALLPADRALVIKTHPNVDPAVQPVDGFDVVARPAEDLNDWLCAADVLVTDYSSSLFEWALLRRPLVLAVDDLEAYEQDPGLYLDVRTDLVGAKVRDTDEAARAILEATVDDAAWDAFIAEHMGACDGHAAERVVERFIPTGRG